MKLDEIFITDDDIDEWKATRELCKSSRSNSSLGASALASCKSQGFRATNLCNLKKGPKRAQVLIKASFSVLTEHSK